MMKLNRILGFASVLLVAACVNTQKVDEIRDVDARGMTFNQSLTREYKEIALFEGDEMQDWESANYFAEKGLRAAEGSVVTPEDLVNRSIDSEGLAHLQSARAALVSALGQGRSAMPEVAAKAQAKFDCWVEQLDEGTQSRHIDRCRQEFCAAMAEVTGGKQRGWNPVYCEPQKMVQPMRDYTVYFALGSAQINAAGMRVISAAAVEAKARGTRVTVAGHTDRSGSAQANQALSQRRADAVRSALMAQGLDGRLITTVVAFGEDKPAVPTADGQVEQRNRRVEIIIN